MYDEMGGSYGVMMEDHETEIDGDSFDETEPTREEQDKTIDNLLDEFKIPDALDVEDIDQDDGKEEPHELDLSPDVVSDESHKFIGDYGLTKLGKIVHAQKVRNSCIDEARRQALREDNNVRLNDDPAYVLARTNAGIDYRAQLESLRDFVLNEDALTPTKISAVSSEYKNFGKEISDNFHLGRIAKCMWSHKSNHLKIRSRVIAAAGLSMIEYYNKQTLNTPHGQIMPLDQNDVIRVATVIARYVSKFKGEVEYNNIINYLVGEKWKKNARNPTHTYLDSEGPHRKNFLISDVIGRLVESEVLSGKLIPTKTDSGSYKANLVFRLNDKYVKK